jgi:hypothetical protein
VSINRLHQGPGFRRTALRENWAKALDFKECLYKESEPGFRRTALRENWAKALDFKEWLYKESAQVAGS